MSNTTSTTENHDDDILQALTDTERDAITDAQRFWLRVVYKVARHAVQQDRQEERKRFDWLRFMVQAMERFGNWCNEMAKDIKARMK